jgi:hypothetical protein
LPKNGVKKAVLSEYYSCEHLERGPDLPNVGAIHQSGQEIRGQDPEKGESGQKKIAFL